MEQPKPGETREVKRYAYLPKKIGSKWVWFGYYTSKQMWMSYQYPHDEVVSSGLITEKYRTVWLTDYHWVEIMRKWQSQ